jgi:putative phosphoesterase
MPNEIAIGLIADTHVPDRRRQLHPNVVPTFKKAGVTQILHAGDISVTRVLQQLGEVAPVVAVRGNRDWFGLAKLPISRIVEIGEVRIGLTHGHVGWRMYAKDKLAFLLSGRPQSFDYFTDRVVAGMLDMDVIVFGHNHEPFVRHIGDQLVINPGSACCQMMPDKPPSVALLYIEAKKVRGEIVFLD